MRDSTKFMTATKLPRIPKSLVPVPHGYDTLMIMWYIVNVVYTPLFFCLILRGYDTLMIMWHIVSLTCTLLFA